MEEANILVAPDQFSCLICLDLLKDPVALLCGHSFCMECINICWDQEDQRGVYRCPQCKETFTSRPAVSKNTVLAEVVETLKKARLQTTPPAQSLAGPEVVDCDFCTERKHKAIKSCLVCLASFCETHLQPHYKSPAFKKHKLVEASRRLQEQICSQHDKLLEVYCRTDQQCICMLCAMDQHKGHDTVSAAAGRAEKQQQLFELQRQSKQKILDREKELQKLRTAMTSYTSSAQTAVKESMKFFTRLTALIRAQEKAEVSRAEEVMKQLEQEIAELRRRDDQLQELSSRANPVQFLQSFQSVSTAPGSADSSTITYSFSLAFDEVLKSVSQLREKLETFFNSELKKISPEVKSSGDTKEIKSGSHAWEKKIILKEERKAESILKPFCGDSSDVKAEPSSDVQQAVIEGNRHNKTKESCSRPVTSGYDCQFDLHTKTHKVQTPANSTTTQDAPFHFSFDSTSAFTFADLANNFGGFSFRKIGKHFLIILVLSLCT
ncbi:E3 ubiquitin/ISG15 ligase TRIM25-like [Clarias gariepinus]